MLYNILPSKVMYRLFAGVGVLLLSVSTGSNGQERSGPQQAQGSESSRTISAIFQRPSSKRYDERYGHVLVSYCAAYAERVSDSVVWGGRSDTIPWGPYDTLPTEVRRRARECSAQIKLEQVDRIFLEPAANLALIAGNDSLLLPILDSLIIMERDMREAGTDGFPGSGGRFFTAMLRAAPARVDLARRMLARNDLLNGSAYPKGNGNRLMMTSRRQMYSSLSEFGRQIADVQLMEEGRDSVQSIFDAFEKTYPDSISELARLSQQFAYLNITRAIYAYRFGTDSVFKVLEREIKTVLSLFPNGSEREARSFVGVTLTGMKAPSADAPFSFFRDGIKQIPEPGQSMVVLMVGENCEASCGAEIMRFKRLIGDIPTVMFAEAYGNVRRSHPGTPAENAEALRAHLQDSLGIKLSLVVDTAPHYITPDPDLKYLYGQSGLRLRWADAGTSSLFKSAPQRQAVSGYAVINKNGVVVWESNFFNPQLDNKKFATYVIRKIAEE